MFFVQTVRLVHGPMFQGRIMYRPWRSVALGELGKMLQQQGPDIHCEDVAPTSPEKAPGEPRRLQEGSEGLRIPHVSLSLSLLYVIQISSLRSLLASQVSNASLSLCHTGSAYIDAPRTAVKECA